MEKALKVVGAVYSETQSSESFNVAGFECKMRICGERAEDWGGKDYIQETAQKTEHTGLCD